MQDLGNLKPRLVIAHGHSFHMIGGLAEFAGGYGVSLSNVNSIFLSDVDIESNQLAGVRVANNRNVVIRNCTFETNGRSLADSNNEKAHLLIGTFNTSHVVTDTCFFHAGGIRNIVRIDRGVYIDRDSQIFNSESSAAWVGTGSRGAVMVFTDAAYADVRGNFDVARWPTGPAGNIPIFPSGRSKNTHGKQASTWLAATPTYGTWERGDLVHKPDPAPSVSPGWRCTAPGTSGTLNEGATTGSITSGTKVLTVNSTTGLFIGAYIKIGAITQTWRVLSISGTTIGVEQALNPAAGAGSTQTDAAITFAAPVWTPEAALGA
ncbi:hypothetical protein DC31_13980 [Microbacterium sp. CH12i]|uniref:right-handed parallel beta-helix repeat-containing protein n=1 Tax=Microbacterium sp. CH12i TaxID=1479651 RepID=UPI0004610646|nr:right-handed parallel beta-helix repeat-containing protein [Microbacterium sp. CH12i]KDA05869.1 hypothetical protein DC31_13980 [Microbacterium sp. CH12i]